MSAWWSGKRAIVSAGLIFLVVGALGIYLNGVRQDAEISRLEPGMRACSEVMGIYQWLDYDGAEVHAAPTMGNAGADLSRVAGPYPRLNSLVQAIENVRRELLSGQPAGPSGHALLRECEGLGWRRPPRP